MSYRNYFILLMTSCVYDVCVCKYVHVLYFISLLETLYP